LAAARLPDVVPGSYQEPDDPTHFDGSTTVGWAARYAFAVVDVDGFFVCP
jgi:hypothetical protein